MFWSSSEAIGRTVRCRTAMIVTTLAAMIVGASTVQAGPFSISPLRIELGAEERFGVFTVYNEGDEDLDVQFRIAAWSQDATGLDVYEETDEVLLFPLIAKIPAGGERFVRVTHQLEGGFDLERTYRLFAEELPNQAAAEAPLRFALEVSIPVLVGPSADRPSVTPTRLVQRGATLEMFVRNDGNRHARLGTITVQGLDAAGNEVYTVEGVGWYLLRDVERPFAIELPVEQCRTAVAFHVTFEEETTGPRSINGAADPSSCPDDGGTGARP